jgi:hypothetical protein
MCLICCEAKNDDDEGGVHAAVIQRQLSVIASGGPEKKELKAFSAPIV